jgi:hypothetical protein
MNALLLPVVLGFLVRLAMVTLPESNRLKGRYLWLTVAVGAITCAFGVLGGIGGILS